MRNRAWLRRILSSLDLIYFSGQLHESNVDIKWFRPPVTSSQFLFGQVDLGTKMISINSVLANSWVPEKIIISTILHEAIHVVLGAEHTEYFKLLERMYPFHTEVALWEADSIDKLMAAPRPLVRELK